ncbi:MAG: lipoyl synthase [Candidatus Aenigmarchaeota archaeon]|nr:lipoyl synthase [Candidatus Aenigmarchaeota archaeon]
MDAALKPRIRPPAGAFPLIRETVRSLGLQTVCQEARCPNQGECWSGGTATFLAMGDTCTRGCKFCHVRTRPRGQPLDPEEPAKLAAAVRRWGLRYAVITSVDRDDLPDQGAGHLAACVRAVRATGARVEALVPDFRGERDPLAMVAAAEPDVLAHNLETVERLQHPIRDPRAGYRQSLGVLAAARELGMRITKSSLMLGLGETEAEVLQALQDLRAAGVDMVTLGQYLQPSSRHWPVRHYLGEEEWARVRALAEGQGFAHVAAGPLVRSSYRAGEAFAERLLAGKH